MTDKIIRTPDPPLKIKILVSLGLYAARILSFIFFFLFVDSIFHLLKASGEISVTFLSAYIYTYDAKLFYIVRSVITLILTILHAFCCTGIRHWQNYSYPLALIICYLFILFIAITIKSLPFTLVALLLIIIWCMCFWGLCLFRIFRDDPIDEGQNTHSKQIYYESYGHKLISPIKVDTPNLLSKKVNPKDQDEPSNKDYFDTPH